MSLFPCLLRSSPLSPSLSSFLTASWALPLAHAMLYMRALKNSSLGRTDTPGFFFPAAQVRALLHQPRRSPAQLHHASGGSSHRGWIAGSPGLRPFRRLVRRRYLPSSPPLHLSGAPPPVSLSLIHIMSLCFAKRRPMHGNVLVNVVGVLTLAWWFWRLPTHHLFDSQTTGYKP